MTVTKISEEFSMISSNVEKGFWGKFVLLKVTHIYSLSKIYLRVGIS